MNRYLLAATVADRFDTLKPWIDSCRKYLHGWLPICVAQSYTPEQEQLFRVMWPECKLITLPEGIGPHRAKIRGLRLIDNDPNDYVVCSVDDDMVFLPQTNFTPCVSKCLEPGVGFVSAGWVKDFTRLPKHKLVHEFVKQPIVYTGGGMIFSRKISKLVLDMPDVPFASDNTEWSIKAYLKGYENFRYRGSVSIHGVGAKGGLRKWRTLTSGLVPTSSEIIKIHEMKNSSGIHVYKIGKSEDLTPLAHEIHRKNKKQ